MYNSIGGVSTARSASSTVRSRTSQCTDDTDERTYSERTNQKSEKYSTLNEMRKNKNNKKEGNNFLSDMNEDKNSIKNLNLFDRKISTFKTLGEKYINKYLK